MLTRALFAAAGAILMVAAVPAPGSCATGTPLALAKALYAAEQASLAEAGPPPWETPRRFFDARLNELFERDRGLAEREDIGNLQFDPLCDAQDCEMTSVRFSLKLAAAARGTVRVRFRNFGSPNVLLLEMTCGKAGWRISDIVNPARSGGWRLSAILSGADR